MKDKQKLPPMIDRPVFVSYVARRRCRFNPSADRMFSMPLGYRAELVDRWRARHKGATFPSWEVSRRPARTRKEK